jgi:aminoglycoside/choline kinase family phosphotransferase
LYLGLILYNQKISNPAAAVVQFDEFLADSPPAAEVQSAASRIAGAYKAAGVAVPAVVTADLSSGTAAAG